MKSSTIASAFVRNMLEGAIAKGHNVDHVLAENGISPDILLEDKSRVTFDQLARLSRSLMRLLDDESYGLTDKPQRKNTFKLICYSAINAETVGEALKLFVEFLDVVESSLGFELVPHNEQLTCRLKRHPESKIKNHYAIDHLMLVLHRTLCWMANTRIPILRVNLDYPPPAYRDEYRYIFYDAPIFFDQKHCSMTFNQKAMNLLNVRDKTQLVEFLKLAPLTLLSQTFKTDDLSSQLRNWLEKQITKHQVAPDIDAAAAHFRLHPQTMRRQLKKEGTSYQDIKTETRRDLAINLINHQKHSIESIAFQLNFSEPSAFIRAFKGWTGLTPLAYRKLSC